MRLAQWLRSQKLIIASGEIQGKFCGRFWVVGGPALTGMEGRVELKPFEGASNRTAIVVLEQGRVGKYPVPHTHWRKEGGGAIIPENLSLEEAQSMTVRRNFVAEPSGMWGDPFQERAGIGIPGLSKCPAPSRHGAAPDRKHPSFGSLETAAPNHLRLVLKCFLPPRNARQRRPKS